MKYLIFSLCLFFSGCSVFLNQPLKTEPAQIGTDTETFYELNKLPPPKEKIVASVYKFRDNTGQYKQTEMGSSWSTAVTQGATSILLRALEASQWFVPLEREGLSNLLNERKIIRSSRSAYMAEQANNGEPLMPPLLFAGIILEGGIISYDYNIVTGGAGLRYFGTGGSGEYRQDRVSIYLRAVSTQNGRILKTVYTTNTILSQKIDVGVFKFVKFKRLLEAETGITFNEPSELAVKEAIEKAVSSLIIEGVYDGLWDLNDPEDLESESFTNYNYEKELAKNTDAKGYLTNKTRKSNALEISGGTNYFWGDYKRAVFTPEYSLTYHHFLNPKLHPFFSANHNKIKTADLSIGSYNTFELGCYYQFYPNYASTTFLKASLGTAYHYSSTDFKADFDSAPIGLMKIGAGVEYLIGEHFGVNGVIDYTYFLNDNPDFISQGKYNDFKLSAKIGLRYYFNLNQKEQ